MLHHRRIDARRWLPALAALLAADCGPDPGPRRIEVVAYDRNLRSYSLATGMLSTLEDAESLRGTAATAVGGLALAIDASGKVSIPRQGRAVHAQYLERDGVLWPLDYDTLALATAYFDFEQARAYAQARGLGSEIDGVKFSYDTQITLAGKTGILTDNAAWIGFLHLFIFPPLVHLGEIPLTMNAGVISHEYGHAIFGSQVYPQGDDYLVRWCPLSPVTQKYTCTHPAAYAMIGIVEEGFADSWALGVTEDPLFLERSIPSATSRRVEPFDVSRHCTSQASLSSDISAHGLDPTYWNARKYQYGTVWAAALWRAGQADGTSHEAVMNALFASYAASAQGNLRELIATDPDGSEFEQFAELAIRAVRAAPDAATAAALCDALQDRLYLDLKPACPTVGSTECGP